MRADARMLRGQTLVVRAHHRVHRGGALDEVILLVDVQRRQRRGERHRVARVGEAAVEHHRIELLGDVPAHGDGAQRQVRGGQALGHGHQVGDGVPVLDREPPAGAPETRHHLVGDHQDAVAIAELANALDVAVRRNEDAVGADDGLEEDRRDRVRSLVHDHVLETAEALLDRPRLALAPAMRVGIPDHADQPRLRRPAARIAGERHRTHGRPVIRAVASEDLVAAGVLASDLDRVLDRLGAAEREEDLVEIAGQQPGQLLAETRSNLGDERRLDELQPGGLLDDGVDDPLVAVTDVHRHQLAVEIENARCLPACTARRPRHDRRRSGSTAPCTDHEKNVCSFDNRAISSLVIRLCAT